MIKLAAVTKVISRVIVVFSSLDAGEIRPTMCLEKGGETPLIAGGKRFGE